MTQRELAEMKALQEVNRRLRRVVAQKSLDLAATKEFAKGKW
jgi:hypothetical protein